MATGCSDRPRSDENPFRAAWETNAEWWDAYYQEGNDFHRTLIALLEPFFRNGFVLDGLEETAFTDPSDARGPLSWDHYPEIPPVLVVRLRPARLR